MRNFRADLHIHSCLSPCGSLYSSPVEIVRNAKKRELDIIALTDHNSSLNCPAFRDACLQAGITGIFGMEATSIEEVHCLCLFEECDAALEFGKFIDGKIQKIPLDPDRMGDQVVVDLNENIIGSVNHLLIAATELSVDELEKEVHRRRGIFIPAHVDRTAFSFISQLGFIPRGNYDALEWYRPDNPLRKSYRSYPAIFNSDAHDPGDVGRRYWEFSAERPDFEGIRSWLDSAREEAARDG